ncbi:AcrB/AcrD/AcrF family protein [candidate division Kazan bacterium]|uniref:AcrB/AcrD/AcrF family protein n=1 Tax=candidate division Kazan bacterium TaxID=2202143 RepID=A0A420ZCK0_UNCK3|nr:MAG: AcrB/AcrD/AcrF family protein [candidate division Kazan bacterium]
MKLPEFSVNRPITTFMIFIGIVLLGVVALLMLPIDMLPNLEIPTLSVITVYRGASAEDIETKVTKVLEDNLATVPKIKEITSISNDNLSAISLRFEWGTDLDEAANDVRQGIDFAKRSLPDDAETPMLVKFDMSMMPILFFGITARESYADLRDIVDKRFCDRLKRIPGVAMTEIYGGMEREIKVEVDKQRLEACNIPIEQLVGILAAQNVAMPAGNLKVGVIDYLLRVPGEFETVADFENVVIGQSQTGNPLYLRDVARIEDSFKDINQHIRINREPALMVMVMKQSGANTVSVVKAIKKVLPGIEAELPEDVEISIAMDTSDFINRAIGNLKETLILALVFVMFVVWIFLRELRGSFIIGLTIPFSLLTAFILLFMLDYTINMMSLSAIIIAIGMVVDDAIVVYENIFRHRSEEGETRREASIFGASEVGLAVTAATFTLIAIYVPVMFVPGITGIMFRELSLAIIVVLAASLFSSLTLTPVLSSKFLKTKEQIEANEKKEGGLKDRLEQGFLRLGRLYKSTLSWSLGHKKVVIVGGAVLFFGSLLLLIVIDTEFMPAIDQGEFMGYVDLPVGTRLEETEKVMEQLEDMMEKSIPEMSLGYSMCGASEEGMGAIMGQRSGKNIISIGGKLVPKKERTRSDRDIMNDLRIQVVDIPGIKEIDFGSQDWMQMMLGSGKPVQVEIYGNDFEVTDSLARRIKVMMDRIPGLTDVTISRKPGKPELWVEVDRKKMAALGLNMAQVASAIRTQFYGTTATQFREKGEEYDTFVRLRAEDRSTLEDVLNANVMTPFGKLVPIRNFASIREELGPLTIERKDQVRVVNVGGGLYKRALGDVTADIKKGLKQIDLPMGATIAIGGSASDQAESFHWLALAFILGTILVYMIMAAQFESLLDPFIIIFSVPFAVAGSLWALFITGNTLSITSFIGIIMLVGIVVKNAIVLVDYANIMRRRGLAVQEALLITGPRRLRPVLMTAATTILGLLPMALKTGEGSEMWRPLAITVIGGLLLSTLVTLVFVPVIYSIFEERVRRYINVKLN